MKGSVRVEGNVVMNGSVFVNGTEIISVHSKKKKKNLAFLVGAVQDAGCCPIFLCYSSC